MAFGATPIDEFCVWLFSWILFVPAPQQFSSAPAVVWSSCCRRMGRDSVHGCFSTIAHIAYTYSFSVPFLRVSFALLLSCVFAHFPFNFKCFRLSDKGLFKQWTRGVRLSDPKKSTLFCEGRRVFLVFCGEPRRLQSVTTTSLN